MTITSNTVTSYEGLCPSCGNWDSLDTNSGWCASCVEASVPAGICIRCKRFFAQDNNGVRRVCSTCRKVEWFHRNADALDRVLGHGYTLAEAIEVVTKLNRPTCLSCGEHIKNGTAGVNIFCRKYAKCRTAARRYRYYRNLKGMNAQQALDTVKEKIVLESLVSEVVLDE